MTRKGGILTKKHLQICDHSMCLFDGFFLFDFFVFCVFVYLIGVSELVDFVFFKKEGGGGASHIK